MIEFGLKCLALGAAVLLVPAAYAEGLAEDDREAFLAVLAAVEEGWETASGAPFRRHFTDAPSARFVESGGADVGLEHLVDHHVIPEGEALDELSLDFAPIEMHAGERFGWILAASDFEARVREDGRRIHSRGFETLLLERQEGRWVVVHSHGSSRPVQ